MDKERFDALMRLADFRTGIRAARRTLEWRVSLGLWLGMGAGLISLPDIPEHILVLALIIAVVIHAFWVQWNWVSNEREAHKAYYYAETAEAMLLLPNSPVPNMPIPTRLYRLFGFIVHGPCFFQILVTIFLGMALVLLAGQPKQVSELGPPILSSPPQAADIR